MSIPFIDLKSQYRALQPQIRARIDSVLEHGQYIMGPEVRELEQRLEEHTGAQHCITVASGTEALLISLMALGVGPGDEVITSPFTFIATAEAICLLGATPVLVDVELETANLDARLLEDAITPKTKAIMPVSLYGQTCDMDEINAIALRHGGIPVIEDAAQSFGAEYRGRRSCNLSTIGCTSFFPSKPLGCYGDGGAIFTSDARIAQACREIRIHGQSRRYYHSRIGVGGRMDTLQCAITLAKLERFDWEIQRRQELGREYNRMLDAAGISRIQQLPGQTSVYAQYTILVVDRDRLQALLNEAGIPTAIHYPLPVNRQPAYLDLVKGKDTPISDTLAGKVLSIPMSADLGIEDARRIIEVLASACQDDGALPQIKNRQIS